MELQVVRFHLAWFDLAIRSKVRRGFLFLRNAKAEQGSRRIPH